MNSQVFDHTSVIRFIETWTGVKDHNISHWRRRVSGDLTSCFDFANPDFSIPTLPDTTALLAAANADNGKPAVRAPAAGSQVMPIQEPGTHTDVPLPVVQTEVWVSGASTQNVDWELSDGYYDVVVTANTATGFRYRFAGHIEH